jgi:hypothetical protein
MNIHSCFDQSVLIFFQSVSQLIHVSNVIRSFRVFKCIIKYLDKDDWYSTSIFRSREFLFCIDWFDWLLVFKDDLLVNHDCFFCRWFMQIRLE